MLSHAIFLMLVMQSVVMLNVFMMSVVAPKFSAQKRFIILLQSRKLWTSSLQHHILAILADVWRATARKVSNIHI